MTAASARGLFRATGKKSRPVAVRSATDMLGSFEVAEHIEREKEDFYPTPPEPTRALLAAEMDRVEDFPLIWEPACGDGAMIREIQAAGLQVHGSDLIDRGCEAEIRSFYDFKEAPSKAIITNPPFDECGWGHGKARWLYHALDALKIEYMALLLTWSWAGAGGLAHLWETHPPARVYLMRWRIDFTRQGASPMLFAWWVWDKKWRGDPRLYMLDRKDIRQAELFTA